MDVHDVGDYKIGNEWRVFEPGMALTIEPGIYVAPGTPGRAEEIPGHRHPHRGRRGGHPRRLRGAHRRRAQGAGGHRAAHGVRGMNGSRLRRRHRRRRHGGRELRARAARHAAARAADRRRAARFRRATQLRRTHHGAGQRLAADLRDPRGLVRRWRREAAPIRSIHVSDAGRFGVARLDAAEQGVAGLRLRGAESRHRPRVVAGAARSARTSRWRCRRS